ncbi:branched-chain amino acid ABC transporter permease [Roseomonas xinghualingensis]|uniref:branched-chain amino acid ABC transporter permease n=1 Tax=Roseomonas xinghualingensis TaxID=2986475 RepID=UPI0021F1E3CD|nr:branched-chain amino acid ABC transporter permease [Roseomonas sp. SXEYE001]MCV4206241.1 branched-chain amino acid ABC transporter permease [Roseomonas sp. SXEYE001]
MEAAAATLVTGLVLGGMYALVAIGLTLQYGVARIMNLAYGEFVVAAAFAALWLFTSLGVSPLIGLALVMPLAFLANWAIYRIFLTPLVRRAPNAGALETDSILATFGLLFVVQGVMLALFGGAYQSYSYLSIPVEIFGATITANRLVALGFAAVIGGGLWFLLTHTRTGTAVRAVAVNPAAAPLVGIDMARTAALAFAAGGAVVASGGVLVSTFLTFNAAMGVVFTMKALVVVIMGGVGNLMGCLVAGLLLGLTETLVASFVDPGLTLAATYGLFLTILIARPAGLFGVAAR